MMACCGGCFEGIFGQRPTPRLQTSDVVDNNGQVRDMYQIEKKELGAGSYGHVSKCIHNKSRQARALKSIKKAQGKNAVDRCYAEIAIMKKLDHPSIIKLYESFEDRQYIYLIMELCTGGELFDRIVEANHFTETQAAIIMKQMISSIYYLHSNHICHRDLKPENFLFQTKTEIETDLLKLIDFGLATRYTQGQVLHTKSGTPYYVAPEVLRGSYNEACDLWSCGVIMFVLLCGYPPFHADTDREILSLVGRGEVKFDPTDWRDVSQDAKNLIRLLVEKDYQKKRYTAEQALGHVWISKMAPQATKEPLQAGVVGNLRSFNAANRFKRLALQVIATQLSEDKYNHLRRLFLSLDNNGDGMLSIKEISDGLKEAKLDSRELQQILSTIDCDRSGMIEYKEFLAATMDQRDYLNSDACWSAFCVFDKNGDGKISLDELKLVLKDESVGAALKDSKLQSAEELMREIDRDGNNEIDFEEFMAMMTGK
eukprot:TRINITY_DN41645_c0_g1_i1.p1 TRINITY_DN41645_c0_g1~~TRINITY_DN41645_c0_g1_i1.p1  ORF type:complete len:484 (+),score=101.28 TRINITY_DN41645_c0_g1_i1:61-1512(+)